MHPESSSSSGTNDEETTENSVYLILHQTLSIDQYDVLVMIQLIARQLLIVLDRRREIAIDGRCDSRFNVDIRQSLSQDRAVGAVIRRLLALELLTQMREVMTRWSWLNATLLIVHLLVHGRDRVGNGDCDGRSEARCDVVKHDLLVDRRLGHSLRQLLKLMMVVVVVGVGCC